MSQSSLSSASLWIMAARPRTLPAAAAPVLIGFALAWRDGVFNLPAALSCLFVSLLMQIGANFANDLFDHERGSDTPDRLGPIRVAAAGLISPKALRFGLILVFGLASILGLYLTWLRGWPVLVLGVSIIIAALAYTGGPFPYGYYAMGDIFVLLSFGLAAVCGTYYAQSGILTPSVIWASLPVGFLIVNILVVNNTRDIETDAAANKRTLAVFFGRKAMFSEYLICLGLAYLIPPFMWLLGLSTWGGMLSWLSVPFAMGLFREFTSVSGRQLNKTLAGTAQLALVHSLLFSVGLAFFG